MRRVLLAAGLLAALAIAASAQAKTTWLCGPGAQDASCGGRLSTAVFEPWGVRAGTGKPKVGRNQPIDCFYVYPTVSDEKTVQADLAVTPELRSIALFQVSRYSQYCRVYAPVYRQVTLAGLNSGKDTLATGLRAYGDVLAAWRDYWANINKGRRGFVLIGHSQGSAMLERLIAREIETSATRYDHMIAAYLLGGNVFVKDGSDTGGTFEKVKACRSATQLHCVVAFSTFDAKPPADSTFGRMGGPLATAFGSQAKAGYHVLCTNPASLEGGAGDLDPILPTAPFAPGTAIAAGIGLMGVTPPEASTIYVRSPGAFKGRCVSTGGADVLMATPQNGAPTPKAAPDPGWGLHLLDANIAQGNLLALLHSESSAYLKAS